MKFLRFIFIILAGIALTITMMFYELPPRCTTDCPSASLIPVRQGIDVVESLLLTDLTIMFVSD